MQCILSPSQDASHLAHAPSDASFGLYPIFAPAHMIRVPSLCLDSQIVAAFFVHLPTYIVKAIYYVLYNFNSTSHLVCIVRYNKLMILDVSFSCNSLSILVPNAIVDNRIKSHSRHIDTVRRRQWGSCQTTFIGKLEASMSSLSEQPTEFHVRCGRINDQGKQPANNKNSISTCQQDPSGARVSLYLVTNFRNSSTIISSYGD